MNITVHALTRKQLFLRGRSRKAHLIDEYGLLDVMEIPESSTFETDFGVTFGSIICGDIMHNDTWQAFRNLNITDIVHTSGWFSEMPFLTTIPMEAGWAYAEDVNLLSSGYNNIGWGDSGSGIIAGRQGVVIAILPLDDHEELLIADVRKKNRTVVTPITEHVPKHDIGLAAVTDQKPHMPDEFHQKHVSEGFKWRYEKLDAYETKLIAENGLTVETLSHIGIHCEFQVNITNLSPLGVTYRLLALDGVRLFGDVVALGTRVCAIVLCADDTIDSCGHIRNSSATFTSINITASYIDNTRTTMMPSTLRTDMLPFNNWTWHEHKHKDHINTSMFLAMPTQNLVTFGIWGRNFEKYEKSLVARVVPQLLSLPLLVVLLENGRICFS